MDADETQGIENARETRDLVLAAMLDLAVRVIEHVEEHEEDGVQFATLGEEVPAGGYSWKIAAKFAAGSSFVLIEGEPENDTTRAGVATSMAELAAVIGGQSASFRTQVPRSWVELAAKASDPR